MTNDTNLIHVVVVDDDDSIRTLLCEFLQNNGVTAREAENDAQLWHHLQHHRTDLIVLDINLPIRNGIEICREIRQSVSYKHIPVIMLTAKSSALDRILGLETGADDYVPKPFEPLELLSRIRSVLRRSGNQFRQGELVQSSVQNTEFQKIQFSEWTLDLATRELLNSDRVLISLSSAEYRFLKFLLSHANRVLSRDQLMEEMQGRDTNSYDRSIDLQISRLRQKLELNSKSPKLIKTIRNEGYMLVANIKYIL
jgi:two-component system, OmpR family, response regulator